MNKDIMGQYVVIDLEFFKTSSTTEIIEIAAQKIYVKEGGKDLIEGDMFRKIVHTFHKPPEKIMDLIGISYDDYEQADNFKNVFMQFLKWVDEDSYETMYATWGARDATVLKHECQNIGLTNKYNEMIFVDIQQYIMQKESITVLPSLIEIVEKKFGQFKGENHHALNDVCNTVEVLKDCLS